MIEVQQSGSLPDNRIAPRHASRLEGTRLWTSHFLSREEKHALEDSVLPAKSVRTGADLVREGERTDSLFIVVDGWACRYMTTSDGKRQFSALILPGDVGNLDSLMFDRLDYGLRTLGQAMVVVLPRERALALCASHPGIARTFTWLAMAENLTLSKWTLSLGCRTARERVAHLFCELNARLDAEDGNQSSFEHPLTQEQIGDALGLTAVHVNRTIQQLRAEGVVVTTGRKLILPDLARLRRIAEFDPRYLHLHPVADRELS